MLDDDEPMDPQGELVDMPEVESSDVEDTEDGGAIVTLDEEMPDPDSDFYANLAETLPDNDLKALATEFIDLIERDREARKKRDEQYEEGIRRTGLGDDAPGGAQFQGASKVVHPMLTEVCVDFAARAAKELLPPAGPVKDNIIGDITAEKIKKARRKTALMNWQLTTQSPEFRSEMEQLLTQVPLGGAQYMKVTWNEGKNRPEFLFVAIDDIYLPFAASNFYTAQRKTHVQYLTQLDYERRVKSGMYRDVDLTPVSAEPERSGADLANDKIEGRSASSYNEDGLRTVYEIYATAVVEGDEAAPYIISVDKSTSEVLSIYRNWDEDDQSEEELQWIVEFPFVPWRGAYPIGIVHMIGGLSAATTGALRALMDSAHIQNAPTMLKLKGGSRGGQSLSIQPTQVEEIEGGLNVDDVRKLAMPLPFNPPSPILFNLLSFLVDAGKGVVKTTMDDTGDIGQYAPVGTTLAKIEQGMVVFSAIHTRLHNSMARLLGILHRLNAMYLDDEDLEQEVGEELATRQDFNGPMDVVPVSDPNIFSETQRFAQVQAVAQRAAAIPGMYNQRKVEERILDVLKIPNGKDLLNPETTPKQQNAVNENVAATMGRPIVAFPEQDHVAHLKTHLAYLMNPALGMNKLIAPAYIPAILNHLKEHIALWYASEVYDLGNGASGEDIGDAMKDLKTNEDRQAFDRMLAEASQTVVEQAQEAFSALPPIIEQAMSVMQQLQPQPPMDPELQFQMQDAQRKAQYDQGRLQVDNNRVGVEKTRAEMDLEIEKLRQDREDQRKAAELATRTQINAADNETAKQLAAAEAISGEKFAFSTGTGINP